MSDLSKLLSQCRDLPSNHIAPGEGSHEWLWDTRPPMPRRPSGLLATHLCTPPARTHTPAKAPEPGKGFLQLDFDWQGLLGGACCQPGEGSLGRGWTQRVLRGLKLSLHPRSVIFWEEKIAQTVPESHTCKQHSQEGKGMVPSAWCWWMAAVQRLKGGAGLAVRIKDGCGLSTADTRRAGWSPWLPLHALLLACSHSHHYPQPEHHGREAVSSWSQGTFSNTCTTLSFSSQPPSPLPAIHRTQRKFQNPFFKNPQL